MSKKSPKPPPAPDYAAAAQQQGQANLDAARLTARLSNPNIQTPLGGQRVTFGRQQFDQKAYDAAMQQWQARQPKPLPDPSTKQANKPPEAGGYQRTSAKSALPPPNADGTFTPPPPTGGPKGNQAPPSAPVGIGGGAYQPGGNQRVQMGGGTDFGVSPMGSYGGMKSDGMAGRRFDNEREFTQVGGNRMDSSMGAQFGDIGAGEFVNRNAMRGAQNAYMGDAMPTREMFTSMVDLDTPNIEQYLTPEAQATLEAQQRVERSLAGLGEGAINRVQNLYSTNFTPQGLPDQQFSFDRGAMPTLGPLEGRASGDYNALPVNFGPTGGQFGMAQGGPGGVNFQGLDTSGISGVQTGAGPMGQATGGPNAPTLQGQLDTRNLAAMPVAAGMTAQQAIMSRLDPQLQRQRSQLETQLANQGLVRGGEAYDVALQEQGQRENDLRTQAALQGLQLDMQARQQGFGEAQALGGFANQAALAGFGAGQQATGAQNAAIAQNAQLALQSGQFANQAQAQQFAQRLASGEFGREAQMASFQTGQAAQDAVNRAISQNFGQALQGQGAYNAAAAQQFGQGMDVQAARNAAIMANQQSQLQQAQAMAALQAQGFNQSQAAAAFQNAQRQAAMQEQLALRNQPLNEITALMGASQVQMPQFQAYQGADVAAAPIFGATQAAGNFAQQNYSNQVSANNARMGMYGSLLGAAGTAAGGGFFGSPFGGGTPAPSDRRLKSNIVRVGTHPLGIGVYEYDIFDRRERGVMADEVEQVKPEAVTTHPTEGYKMVYYGMLQ